MKIVGIISSHRVVNYGSILQAYALQYSIDKLGYKSEYIDYHPERTKMFNMLKNLKNKNKLLKKNPILCLAARIIIFPSYLKRFYSLRKFLKKHIKMTIKKYNKYDDLLNENFNYDVYCTGSDQVWNSEWNNGIDKPYYLSFVPDSIKKISYAASFGREELFNWEKEETKELLSKYSSISVREKSGLKILKELGIKNGQCVLDPTLLLNNEEWSKLTNNKFKNQKYILVYNLNRNKDIYNYAKELSKRTGLKIKYITYQLHDFYLPGKMYCNPSVEDFLSLFKYATYVVTDSFHGTAFSINFNKEFVVIYPKKFSTRLENILELFDLKDRIDKRNSYNIINKKIDYNKINLKLEEERLKSIDFLKNSLK